MITPTTQLLLANGERIDADTYFRRHVVFDTWAYAKQTTEFYREEVAFGNGVEAQSYLIVLEDGSKIECSDSTYFIASSAEGEYQMTPAAEVTPGYDLHALPDWEPGKDPSSRELVEPWKFLRQVRVTQVIAPNRIEASLVPVICRRGLFVPLVAGNGVLIRADN